MIADGTGTFSSRRLNAVHAGRARTIEPAHFLLHVAIPILIGAAIYTCWRSTTLLVFAWYKYLHIFDLVAKVRHATWPARHLAPAWILYSLPDGCWVYSFTAFLASLWKNSPYAYWVAFWCVLPSALAVGTEIGQAFHLVPGTFDVVDVLVYIAAGLLAIHFTRRNG